MWFVCLFVFSFSSFLGTLFKVYPKVKVRIEQVQDHHQHGVDASKEHSRSPVLSLKDIQFLSLQDSIFPVKEHRDVSPPRIARIPKTYVPSVVSQTESASEGADEKNNLVGDNRPTIRAGSIPRPRAVISSPDNDAMIGNKNRVKPVRASVLKNHNTIQSRHTQCNVTPKGAVDETSVTARRSMQTTDDKLDLKGKKGSAAAISSYRRNITADKPTSLRI